MYDLIIYFISRLFFGLDFLNKRYLFASALLCVWLNHIFYVAALIRTWLYKQKICVFIRPYACLFIFLFLYRGSSSLLTFSKTDIYLHPPCCVSELFNIIYIAAFLRSWFSQQKYLFDKSRCAYDLIIYFISRLFFGLDFLNKWYVFASEFLCVWFNYIIYIEALLRYWLSQKKIYIFASALL